MPEEKIDYYCCVCGGKVSPNSDLERLIKDDFWLRYVANIVNHCRKTHLSDFINKEREKFSKKYPDKKFDTNKYLRTRRSRLNNQAKRIIVDNVSKYPRSFVFQILIGLSRLQDNDEKINSIIEHKKEELSQVKLRSKKEKER